MKIAVAQTRPLKGNISANIINHKILIQLASSLSATAIFFPELSLTGYEPELAKDLATDQDDTRLDDLQHISNNYKITIGVGLPISSKGGVKISMIFFQPDSPRQIYSKQHLHSDEVPYFVNGDRQLILTVDKKRIAPAICYESLQSKHSDNARNLGAEVYLASVAKSQDGLDKANTHYPSVAKLNSMTVLMSNCIGPCDNFESVGHSAVWSKEGLLLAQLHNKSEGLIIYDTETEEIIKESIESALPKL